MGLITFENKVIGLPLHMRVEKQAVAPFIISDLIGVSEFFFLKPKFINFMVIIFGKSLYLKQLKLKGLRK